MFARFIKPAVFLALILLVSSLLKLHHLNHQVLTYWDESYHAVVARNLLKHPLEPTLIDVPYLPYDYQDWTANHIWLHKGILPLWIIALSFALFGINTLALRLPSLLFSTGAAGVTYLIGAELLDEWAGLIAAALQAFNPEIMQLVHGYLYSDCIDVCLLFWIELGIYFLVRVMRTAAWRDVLLSGVCCGLAYLSKSYLALIIPALALMAWLIPFMRLGKKEEMSVRGRHVLGLILSAIAIAAPWTLYCIGHYPREFSYESRYAWIHLVSNVEGLGAPWDRLLFDYAIYLFHVFYTAVLAATVVLLPKAFSKRNARLWVVYGWALGVLIPHLFAVTKTPTAILIAMPPFLLLFGFFVSEALHGDNSAMSVWTAIMLACLIWPPIIKHWRKGYPHPPVLAGVMREHLWVIWHLLAAVAGAAFLSAGALVMKRIKDLRLLKYLQYTRRLATGFCILTMIVLASRMVQTAMEDTKKYQGEPTFTDIGTFARTRLPRNATLLFEWKLARWREGDHQLTMFWADRTCYSLEHTTYEITAPKVIQNGGIPYVVSRRRLPLPVVFKGRESHCFVYAWKQPS